jgi:hypothetical protein
MAAANYEFLYQKNDPSTISVLDMSQVDDVATKTNNLALAINTAPDPIKENIWILLASPHSNLQRYDDGQDNNDINDPGDILADLYHSAELIQHLQDVQPEVDLLLSTKDDFVIYEKNWPPNTGPYSKSNGVSIAFPTKPSSFYDGEWIEFAQGADWSFVSNSSTDKLSRDSGFYWGPMVSDLVMTYNPDGPDQSEPPDLVPPGNPDSDSDYKIYLPILLK